MINYPLIVITVLLNAVAQLFIKHGMSAIGPVFFNTASLTSMLSGVATSIPILFGIALYGVSVVLWLIVLSRVNVSLAYPLLSAGYIFVAVFAHVLFNEPLTLQKITGILITCVGIVILSANKG